jgi:sialic acid synthase SpsE
LNIVEASKGKAFTIISTGIGEQADIELVLDAWRRMGNNDTILKCTSSYPALADAAGMCMVKDLGLNVGNVISDLDHQYDGATVPVVATLPLVLNSILLIDLLWSRCFSMNEKEFLLRWLKQ